MVLRHQMPCEPSILYTGSSHTPVKSHFSSRLLLFSFDSFPSHVLLYPLYFPLSVRALSVNDGLGSMSAAIEQCVLTFFSCSDLSSNTIYCGITLSFGHFFSSTPPSPLSIFGFSLKSWLPH